MHIKTATENKYFESSNSTSKQQYFVKTLRQLKLIVAFKITVSAIHKRVSKSFVTLKQPFPNISLSFGRRGRS